MQSFHELGLSAPIQRALADASYQHPTPIQAQAIPPLLDGRDLLGCAQTGTGKTAAFALPILQHVSDRPRQGKRVIRALVLTPTRELAAQIGESVTTYGKFLSLRHMVVFGGVNERPQIRGLQRGIDVLVATPGRLLDLLGRGFIDLAHVELFVLDEADRMLDMGFVNDVRKVLAKLPRRRQNLLFSATMPRSIVELAGSFLRDPVHVTVTPDEPTVEAIAQTVMFVDRPNKRRLLAELLRGESVERAIVFTRTKHGANRLAKQLGKSDIEAAAIHGNKSQGARTRALGGFRDGKISVLIATDIASRGIDVDDVSHVFNYDLPNEPEVYVHRIGRTGRAGRSGIAISFCDATEGGYLRAIERTIGSEIPAVEDHAYHHPSAIPGRTSAPRNGAPHKGTPRRGNSRRGPQSGKPQGGKRRSSGARPQARSRRRGGGRPQR